MQDYSFLIDSMTWSYSRLQSFQKCPYGFLVHYILGEDEDNTYLASFGSFVHEIHQLVMTGELRKSDALCYYVKHFNDKVTGTPPSAEIAKSYRLGTLEYMSHFPKFAGEVVDVEKKLLFDVGGYPFIGFADLIMKENGGIVLYDHKAKGLKPYSGKKKPTKTDIELSEYFRQLYLYAIGIKKEYGEYPSELVFNCYRTQTLIRQKFDETALKEAEKWAVGLIDSIKSCKDWSPDIDFFKCKNLCGLNDRCDFYEYI